MTEKKKKVSLSHMLNTKMNEGINLDTSKRINENSGENVNWAKTDDERMMMLHFLRKIQNILFIAKRCQVGGCAFYCTRLERKLN